MEFIEATYEIVQPRAALNFEPGDIDYPSAVPSDVRSLFNLDDRIDKELLRMNGDKYFLRVLESDYKTLQKAMDTALSAAISARGIYQSYWSKLTANQLAKFPEKNSQYIWRTKLGTDCAGPERSDFWAEYKESEDMEYSFSEYDTSLEAGETELSVVRDTLSGGLV